jgi:hypothetical protein
VDSLPAVRVDDLERHRQDRTASEVARIVREIMDKPRHLKVVRPWKVERLRKPGNVTGAKPYKPKPPKKTK